ncbi:MAG: ATPase [Chloroflexi bacterium RBG_19FT_COMBO_62_14]|nr:MAG: ATPase [Chloroflexi bacterium RBG_19FT_COMBO_62_14]
MPASASTPERILLRLDWQVIRRLDGLLQGDYRSLLYGYGLDFADLREYQPEDDIRYIDWNVTARMNTPYVRQYIEDREISAWFLLDLSPSVDFGSVGRLKRSVLIDFVTTLARLLTRNGNRVGAMFYNTRLERALPARGGRIHVLRLVNDLLAYPLFRQAGFTDLAPLLESGLRTIKKRSLVFIISDFICAPGWDRPLTLLNHRHEVLAIRLWDRRETELPDVGPIFMEDAETGEQLYVDTGDVRFRRRFLEAAERREAEINAAFKRAGVEALSLSTEEDLVSAIVRFAALRRERRR